MTSFKKILNICLKFFSNAVTSLHRKVLTYSLSIFRRDHWTAELSSVFHRFPTIPHLSLYELTVEKGTPLENDVKKGLIEMPSEDLKSNLYEDTVEILKTHGFQRYEISNFSKGEEHRGRHNSHYWKGGNFLGLGKHLFKKN